MQRRGGSRFVSVWRQSYLHHFKINSRHNLNPTWFGGLLGIDRECQLNRGGIPATESPAMKEGAGRCSGLCLPCFTFDWVGLYTTRVWWIFRKFQLPIGAAVNDGQEGDGCNMQLEWHVAVGELSSNNEQILGIRQASGEVKSQV